jgi:predicted cupin superfamily sugar epimerase
MTIAEEIIKKLDLRPHPREGGYFRETYRSVEQHPPGSLGLRFEGLRSFKTAIYYLITPETFSPMHRLPGDEIFHFYLGDPVRMLQLRPNGSGQVLVLGNDLLAGQQVQVVVPGGVWQGCCLEPGSMYALMGTTMAPGFDYADYSPGRRDELIAAYPNHAALIERLTPTT